MTSVLLLSNDTIFSLGLSSLIASDPSMELAHVADETESVWDELALSTPDVIVLDQETTQTEHLCAELTARYPDVHVLIFASPNQADAGVHAAVRGGARGYVLKTAEPDQLLAAIKSVAEGNGFLDPSVTLRVISWATGTVSESHPAGLSRREMEVLGFVLEGEPNKRIARRMGLTENTVKTYLRRAYRKLNCRSRSAAAAALARHGFP